MRSILNNGRLGITGELEEGLEKLLAVEETGQDALRRHGQKRRGRLSRNGLRLMALACARRPIKHGALARRALRPLDGFYGLPERFLRPLQPRNVIPLDIGLILTPEVLQTPSGVLGGVWRLCTTLGSYGLLGLGLDRRTWHLLHPLGTFHVFSGILLPRPLGASVLLPPSRILKGHQAFNVSFQSLSLVGSTFINVAHLSISVATWAVSIAFFSQSPPSTLLLLGYTPVSIWVRAPSLHGTREHQPWGNCCSSRKKKSAPDFRTCSGPYASE